MKTKVFLIFRFYSKIMVVEHGICDHGLLKEIKILVEILFLFTMILFSKMKLLVMLQVKASKLIQDSQQWHKQ